MASTTETENALSRTSRDVLRTQGKEQGKAGYGESSGIAAEGTFISAFPGTPPRTGKQARMYVRV